MTVLDKLFEVIEEDDDGFRSSRDRRKMKLEAWIKDHVVENGVELSVVSKRYLTSENQDLIIYKLATELAEKMIESGLVKVERKDNKFIAKVKGLK